MSSLLARKTKRDLDRYFQSLLQVFDGGLLQKSPIAMERKDQLKPGKFLKPIEHILAMKQDILQYLGFDIREQYCFKCRVFCFLYIFHF